MKSKFRFSDERNPSRRDGVQAVFNTATIRSDLDAKLCELAYLKVTDMAALSHALLVLLTATTAEANLTTRFNNVFGVELP